MKILDFSLHVPQLPLGVTTNIVIIVCYCYYVLFVPYHTTGVYLLCSFIHCFPPAIWFICPEQALAVENGWVGKGLC